MPAPDRKASVILGKRATSRVPLEGAVGGGEDMRDFSFRQGECLLFAQTKLRVLARLIGDVPPAALRAQPFAHITVRPFGFSASSDEVMCSRQRAWYNPLFTNHHHAGVDRRTGDRQRLPYEHSFVHIDAILILLCNAISLPKIHSCDGLLACSPQVREPDDLLVLGSDRQDGRS